MADAVADPLHRFPVFRTSDPEDLRHFASDLFGASRVELKNIEKFEARVNSIELQDIGLAFGATSCEIAIDRFATDFIRLQIALIGRATTSAGGTTAEIDHGHFAVTPSDVRSRTICEAKHQRLILRLNKEPLSQKLAVLLGAKPKGELRFEAAIKAEEPRAQGLSRLIGFLSQQLDSTTATFPAAVSRELEQAVQVAFLCASRHTFSHLLERQESMPAPGIVLRLEEFIEAHWQEAITIERLTAEAGVSARALFRAFERSRGYSPMAFAKGVRLKRARELLMSGDPGVSVTATAFKTNFANPSRFAKDYREAFGELPSQTVSRTRR
jgi:AraC-like DNA-binding protein